MLQGVADKNRTGEMRDRRSPYFVIAIFGLTILVFGQVVTFEFLEWDDLPFVVPHIRREGGLTAASVHWAFFNNFNGWRTPLPYLTYFAEAEAWGLHPGGYHLTNLVIHAASAVLLFLALRDATGASWPSFGAAALFAIHPLHVEPVAWVTGRWDLLCGFFWILAMAAYLAYARTGRIAPYLVALAAYVCALMSKPMALTLPFALLLLDHWPLRRWLVFEPSDLPSQRSVQPRSAIFLIAEKIPFFVAMVAGFLIAHSAKSAFIETAGMKAGSLGQRLSVATDNYGFYLTKFVWPSNLSFFYPHEAQWGGPPAWRIAIAFFGIAAVTCFVVWRRHQGYLVVGWLWFLGVLVPAVGFFQVSEIYARADRYTYLPLIGLAIMVCWALWDWRPQRSFFKAITAIGSVGVLMVLAFGAKQQASYWRTSQSLFEHGLQADSRNFSALNNLGVLASRSGDDRRAEQYWRRALAISPNYTISRHNLGDLYYREGNRERAKSYFEEVLRRNFRFWRSRYKLARCLEDEGDYAQAHQELKQIIALYPNEFFGYEVLADFLARRGEHAAAAQHYKTALRLDASLPKVPEKLGEELEQLEGAESRVRFLERFVREHPRRLDVLNHLAWILATHPDEAVRQGHRAVKIAEELGPRAGRENHRVLDTLAAAYAETNRFREAARTAELALRLAQTTKERERASAIQKRLELYRAGQPFREGCAESNPTEFEEELTSIHL